jgi:TRAP-type C4-dicarboxylate transport system substrate-binding protein
VPLPVLGASLALILASAVAGPAAAQPVVVKMATLAPEGSSFHQILKEMGEAWKQASGGKVQLRLYPGSVAGDDADVVRKMRLGTLNAALLTSIGISNIDKSVLAVQVPMMYGTSEEVYAVLDRMTPRITAALEEKGFVALNFADAGWVRFFTKSAVKEPNDLKAHTLFAWAGDNDAIEIWKGAGFNPVPLPSTEISTALQTGLVSALPTTPQAAVLLQWYTHAKFMTDVKWAMLLGGTVITKATWEKVPAEIRPKLLEAAREAGSRLREESRKAEGRDVEAMQKRGLTIVPVDAKAQALWKGVVETALPKVRGPIVPADAFDEAKKHLEAVRKAGPAK